ncbi:glutathione-disulfide reductase [Anderseniella sp. Alg231-50]|uniref:glutathione-disulfide reductase n=1 Tax=Anderseniella sp. Alg231-50 TaxID=1922226 RepID=UPI000D551CFB
MSEYDYDLFVIGGGSGGVRAARIAATHGARVGIAEEYRYGGTCVIRGCVPKKLFVYASHFAESFEDAVGFGWSTKKVSFDWWTLISNKDKEIDRLNKIYITNLEKAGVELFNTRAEMRDPHSVFLVAEQRHVTAKYILIATGGVVKVDEQLPGIEHVITSNEAFHLEALPERIVIAGGGYIAVEFAGIFAGLGVDTTLLYRGDKILRGFDDDVRDHLTAEMKKKGIDVVTGQVFTKIEKHGEVLKGTLKNGEVLEAGQIMFAIGRAPYTQGLGLEHAGVETRANGAIKVDEYSQTNVDHIYAVGDVTDRVALTPVAIREGHAVADNLFDGKDIRMDHSLIPTAVFSQPEIGTVGLTEAEAREKFGDVDIYKSTFRPMKHTLSGRDERMLMKLIVEPVTDKVVGCHIMGPDAGEMAQLLGISVKMGATKADFDSTMAVHPTASEELVTMRTKWSG